MLTTIAAVVLGAAAYRVLERGVRVHADESRR